MELFLLKSRVLGGYVSVGSCWSKGEIINRDFEVTDSGGKNIAALNEIAAYWPDGSIKWARHTFSSELAGDVVHIRAVKTLPEVNKITVTETHSGRVIKTGHMSMLLPAPGDVAIVKDLRLNGETRVNSVRPVLRLERTNVEDYVTTYKIYDCTAKIQSVVIEANSNGVCVVKYEGVMYSIENLMPFALRMTFGADSDDIKFEYTFFYDGEAAIDFINGLGIAFDTKLVGPNYNRHIKIGTDRGVFHEEAMYIKCEHPCTPKGLAEAQSEGEILINDKVSEIGKYLSDVESKLPVWDRYTINQMNENSYVISKQTRKSCSPIKAVCGARAPGTLALGAENGCVLLGIKDFWQRNPSALEANAISSDEATLTAWFKSPYSEALDFRHYDTRAYRMECNEGYQKLDPLAKGIAITSECFIKLSDSIATDDEFTAFTMRTQKNAVYIAKPEYYHEKHAFGYWGLQIADTELEKLLETQLDAAIEYYKVEIDNRGWYGLLDYGDIMHTYDSTRHKWFYDFGGWAWQNTELVPTYWLWLYFIRTGREDVFTLAEAMSRHTSETDVYHFGPYKGIGSRHNVRHWGCPCKEARISMAGHHRPMYYLIGDRRIGDCMSESANAADSLPNINESYREVGGVNYLVARTGPDWTAFVSDWMTEYERTLNVEMKNKIQRGINDLLNAPLGLGSGPHFGFTPSTGEMKYIGEFTENIHLTVCMGAPQVLMEAIDALDLPELGKLIADYGELYCMTDSERTEHFEKLTSGKQFGMTCLTSGIGFASAYITGNTSIANKAWTALARSCPLTRCKDGFKATKVLSRNAEGKPMYEISWISTGYVAQWCLNVIFGMGLFRDAMPCITAFLGKNQQ